MTEHAEVANPYAYSPGSSTPGASVSPEEGRADLWGFFWLSLINTFIIAVVGIAVWALFVR
ncbi:MAG: hypothetical protein L3K19_01545 [Thermoplasmata archaeon]|nr:hypothetical protein [Thermoplasmata archaeon]